VIISPNIIIRIIIIGFRMHNGRRFTGYPKQMILHNGTTGEILNKAVRITKPKKKQQSAGLTL
jgi:hypothetical protein